MKNRVAPTIILVLMILFILAQAGVIIYVLKSEGLGVFLTLVVLIVPLAIIAALVSVYIERMREIKEEEKDDLSKY